MKELGYRMLEQKVYLNVFVEIRVNIAKQGRSFMVGINQIAITKRLLEIR